MQKVNLISVIIPVFNLENKIQRCLKSLSVQTYDNLEIIIIDDGSTDKTRKICLDEAKKDSRILYFYQENKGVSSARNRGLNICKGNFIVFVDGDDYVDNNHIEILFKCITKSNVDIAICGMIFNQNGNDILFHQKEEICLNDEFFIPLISYNGFGGYVCNKIYSKNIIGNIRFNENIIVAEDLLFNVEVFMKTNKVYVTDKCTYHYLIYTESASQSMNFKSHKFLHKISSYLESNQICLELIKKNKDNKYLISLFEYKLLLVKAEILHLKIKNNIDINNKEDFKEIKKITSLGKLQEPKKLKIFIKLLKLIPFYDLFRVIINMKGRF